MRAKTTIDASRTVARCRPPHDHDDEYHDDGVRIFLACWALVRRTRVVQSHHVHATGACERRGSLTARPNHQVLTTLTKEKKLHEQTKEFTNVFCSLHTTAHNAKVAKG